MSNIFVKFKIYIYFLKLLIFYFLIHEFIRHKIIDSSKNFLVQHVLVKIEIHNFLIGTICFTLCLDWQN